MCDHHDDKNVNRRQAMIVHHHLRQRRIPVVRANTGLGIAGTPPGVHLHGQRADRMKQVKARRQLTVLVLVLSVALLLGSVPAGGATWRSLFLNFERLMAGPGNHHQAD